MTIQVENDNVYSFDRPPRTVTWADLHDLRLEVPGAQEKMFDRYGE